MLLRPKRSTTVFALPLWIRMTIILSQCHLSDCVSFGLLLVSYKLMIVGVLSVNAMTALAFLRTHNLLTIYRPERFAANDTDFLSEGMIAFFGIALSLDTSSLGSIRAFLGAVSLTVSVRPKFLTAVFADTLREFMTFIFVIAFLLLTLVVLLLHFLFMSLLLTDTLSFLFFGSLDLFRRECKFKLSNEVEVKLNFLCSVSASTVRLMDNHLINKGMKQFFRQLCGFLVLVNQLDKTLDLHGLSLNKGKLFFQFFDTFLAGSLLLVILSH